MCTMSSFTCEQTGELSPDPAHSLLGHEEVEILSPKLLRFASMKDALATLMFLDVQQTLTLRKGEEKPHHRGDEIQEHSPLYYQSIDRDLERAVLLWQGQGWCLRDSAEFMKCSGMNAHLCTLPEPKSVSGLKDLP